MFELQRDGSSPLVDQIVERIGDLLQRGQLQEGARLPSIRKLARLIDASPFTVAEAYDRLAARGLIEPRPGRGFFAVPRPQVLALARIEALPDPASDAVGLARSALTASGAVIAAGSGFLPASWQPDATSSAVLARLTRARRPQAWLPCPPHGLPELIESVSARLVQRGIAAGPANLVTTSGASQAFDLVCRALFAPGDAVLVEDPGYFVLFAQLRAHHVRLVPVPRTAEGPDLDALESLCRTHRPRAFFVQTLLHNPTGTSISPANCHRLLSIAEKYALALVEDDVYGDLHAGPAVRLAQIDGLRHVIHVGSFSKLVGPAIRVGFVAAEAALVARLVEGKMLATLSGSALLESIVAAVLGSGRYDRHVEDLRGRLARARRDTFAALTSTGIAFEDTAGAGIFLWGRVPENIDMDRLVRRASAQSILLAKGALFSAEGKCGHYLRFNAAYSAAPALASFLTTEIGAAA